MAVALAGFGWPAAYVTVLPPNNPIADAVYRRAAALRRGYFADRAGQGPHGRLLRGERARTSGRRRWSTTATTPPSRWPSRATSTGTRVFEGAGWFHITGITPALSASAADLALESVRKARGEGLTVSCDLNYRKNLWKYGKPAAEVMRELVKFVDVAIANEEDCQMALGIQADVDVHSGKLDQRAVPQAGGEGAGASFRI